MTTATKTEDTKTEAPKTEAPKTETPQSESSKSEGQKTEGQKKPNKPRPPRNNSRKSNKRNNNQNKADNRLRMLVDASKTEETRVAVAQHGRLEDFEVESLVRRQVKGNIYLAKVTRVEPSLQAAFVNYGGNRHGFLPFSEIHPDYYRIPVADRERLMEEQAELERAAEEEAARIAEEEDRKAAEEDAKENETTDTAASSDDDDDNIVEVEDDEKITDAGADADSEDSTDADDGETDTDTNDATANNANDDANDESETESSDDNTNDGDDKDNRRGGRGGRGRYRRGGRGGRNNNNNRRYSETRNNSDRVSDDADDELLVEPFWKRIRRAYKIQEVIKRGQVVLIQVAKEERGNKGAAVTTYITLPGRYCVLMPNTPQSGGVSRKIANFKDRKRMREILKDLSVPEGMSVILRTAGTTRTQAEIKRDMDYLMRLWNNARDLTLKSTAPALINEEGSLIKRAIRDIYHKDIEEVVVSGEAGYKAAHDMMKMLMPSHAKKVVHYKNATPLFITEKLEQQIEGMHSPQVELKSGGYLVINPTEALISIDVNSGRATKERNIDDTALQTNLEAADEIARQLRLRDLGGLVVIDFIDMDNRRFNGRVEKAMRNALAGDRARIQIGRISSFGLMEMSRQRLHPSITETHFEPCPKCHGMGIVKTVDTMALTILRAVEEAALKQSNANVSVTMESSVALYLLNNLRGAITDLENRYNLSITVNVDHVEEECDYLITSQAKPKDEIIAKDDEDDVVVSDNAPVSAPVTGGNDDADGDAKPKPRRGRRGGAKSKQIETDAPVSETGDVKPEEAQTDSPKADVTENTPKEEAPKKRRPRKVVKKKVEIEEVVDNAADATPDSAPVEKPKAKSKPKKETKAKSSPDVAPINDNGGQSGEDTAAVDVQDDENIAARDAEVVNEKPKSKKKGWWNKITS